MIFCLTISTLPVRLVYLMQSYKRCRGRNREREFQEYGPRCTGERDDSVQEAPVSISSHAHNGSEGTGKMMKRWKLFLVLALILQGLCCCGTGLAEAHILVAYFSATGTTAALAQDAADVLGADLYEIVPEQPYTEADLVYYTGGRCDQEQADASVRPAISGQVEQLDRYDTVIIGYPIWHGEAPRIISTFLESYDFSGKTIILFATSGGSGLGDTVKHLQGSVAEDTTIIEGKILNGRPSVDTLREWVSSLALA